MKDIYDENGTEYNHMKLVWVIMHKDAHRFLYGNQDGGGGSN